MSREIKFRFWDSDSNEWVNPSEIELEYDGANNANIGRMFNLYGKNVIFQQFTGLKDSTGKEIYEGDIIDIDHSYFTENMSEIVQVKWNNSGYWSGISHYGPSCKLKIIGNIYENPELLKDEV